MTRSFREPVRAAIDAILKQQEPFPAVVMNRHWNIVAANGAASRFFSWLLSGRTPPGAGNVLRLMFHPDVTMSQCVLLTQRVWRPAERGAMSFT